MSPWYNYINENKKCFLISKNEKIKNKTQKLPWEFYYYPWINFEINALLFNKFDLSI